MVELTFRTYSLHDERTVDGELTRDDAGRFVIEEPEQSRPNWRIEPDRTVTLVSEKSGHDIEEFATDPHLDGVCLKHDLDYREVSGQGCPMCREEERIEQVQVEQSLRTTWVDDPHDPHGYRDEPPRR